MCTIYLRRFTEIVAVPRIAFISLLSCALGVAPLPGAVAPALAADVMASDVVDRTTLRAFIQRAAAASEASVVNVIEAYAFFDQAFRPDGEWRQGSVYVYVGELDGTIFFRGANRDLEGQNLWDLEDVNGVKFTQELIRAARVCACGNYRALAKTLRGTCKAAVTAAIRADLKEFRAETKTRFAKVSGAEKERGAR